MQNENTNVEIEALERLLLDLDGLSDLESRGSNFNAFETLGVVHTEIRHSNVLSWLLSPRETHGVGESFMKTFVQKLFFEYKNELSSIDITLIEVALMEFYDFQVRRE